MPDLVISARSAPSPGDLRVVPRGARITLRPGVESRSDWASLLSGLTTAIARGASVVWEQ